MKLDPIKTKDKSKRSNQLKQKENIKNNDEKANENIDEGKISRKIFPMTDFTKKLFVVYSAPIRISRKLLSNLFRYIVQHLFFRTLYFTVIRFCFS